jgi:DHA1 family bicyclomycin/chloramphenicol resistance-like MFS transporter
MLNGCMKIIILLLGALSAFGPLSIDMYLPALPQIAADFKVELANVQLSLASFFIGLALGQIFYGPITDRYGRKKPLYVGLAIYAFASFMCATSTNINSLIFFRFIQALGACAGMVIPRAVVRDKFHARESAKVFSLLMLIMGIAPILAPLLGGALAKYWGWRSIFWLLTVLSTCAIFGLALFLPETHTADVKIRFGQIFKTYFKILKNREFAGYTFSGGLAQSGLFAYITGSPFVFMEIFNLTPDNYGWIFGSNAFGLIFMSQVNGRLLKTYPPQKILSIIYSVMALLGVLLILDGIFKAPLLVLCVSLFLYLAIMGMIFPNSTACALSQQGAHAGSASALMGTLQFGLSAVFSTLVSHFHDGTMLPMTIIMGVCGIGSCLVYRLVAVRN